MSIWDFVLHYTKIYKTEVEQKNVPRQENQGDVHGRQQEQAAGPEGGSRSVTVRAGEVLKLQSGMLLLLWVGTQGYSHRESDSAGRILWHQCGLSARADGSDEALSEGADDSDRWMSRMVVGVKSGPIAEIRKFEKIFTILTVIPWPLGAIGVQ